MLKKLYQLQQLETALSALDSERVNSDEYKQLRTLRQSFDADKQKLAESKTAIAKIEGKIAAVGKRITDLESRVSKEKAKDSLSSCRRSKPFSCGCRVFSFSSRVG